MRAYYYDAIKYTNADNESNAAREARIAEVEALHHHIAGLPGYHVREGYVRRADRRRNPNEQKAVDIQLAVDALEHAARRNMIQCELLTGDLDFEPLLHSLVRLGVTTRVHYVPGHASTELLEAADTSLAMTLVDFYNCASGQFRQNHQRLELAYHQARPPIGPNFVEKVGTHDNRRVELFRAVDGHHKVFLHPGDELRQPSASLSYQQLDKLELAFNLTFGDPGWRSAPDPQAPLQT